MQQTLKQSPWRIVLDAIVRMSATRANYWAELVLDAVLCLMLLSRAGGTTPAAR